MSYRQSSYVPSFRAAALAATIVFGLLLPLGGSRAANGDITLPAALRDNAPQLELLGEGRFTWWGFSVYDARLYAEIEGFGFDRHFVLELEYAREFAAEDIVEVSLDEMRRLGDPDEAQLAAWRDAMAGIFPDVDEGDRLIGLYDPDGRAQFYDAAGLLGTIEDPAFARAFFEIWLHPESKAEDLRRELLGEEPAEQREPRITVLDPTD